MTSSTEPVATFNPSAEVYEDRLVPSIFAPWGERLVELAAPRTGERVLDVACGSGIVARIAHPQVGPGGTVVGLDVNPAMLEVARAKSAHLRPAISWEQGDAGASLPFPDAAFDVVLCQQGLQFFTDRLQGLAEMRRVTAPRGRVALSVWRGPEHHRSLEAFDEVLTRHLPAEATQGINAPFALGDLGAIRDLVRTAGFTDVHLRVRAGEVRFGSAAEMLAAVTGAFAPLAEAVAALHDDRRDELVADLTAELGGYTDDDGVMYPMVSSTVLARP